MADRKGKKSKKSKSKGKYDEAPVISDPRFQHVQRDPRFQILKKRDVQMTVDKRFQRMFTDKSFNVIEGAVDKRGRRVASDHNQNELQKLYRLEGDGEDGEPSRLQQIVTGKSADQQISQSAKRDIAMSAKIARLNALARGEVEAGSSSDDSDDSSSEDVDMAAADAVLKLPEAAREPAPLDTMPGQETSQLAVVDLDWENVRAVDLLVAMQSFCPATGKVVKVQVVPSKYGLEQMEKEQKFGPSGIWHGDNSDRRVRGDSDSEEDDPFGDSHRYGKRRRRTWRDGGYDKARLRQYELNKLKYYFAVVHCDSPKTAAVIYNQCDGMEYERTGNTFDLQFIPAGTEMPGEPRDEATAVPEDYEPHLTTAPKQRTNVHSSWDQPDQRRVKKMRWETGPQVDVDEDNFKAYLANDSSSDDSDDVIDPDSAAGGGKLSSKQQKIRSKYKSLLAGLNELSDDDEEAAPKAGPGTKVDADGNVELTFTPGLGEELLRKRREKAEQANESVFEASRRKAKEKRKAKRKQGAGKGKEGQEEGAEAGEASFAEGFEVDEGLANDPFFAGEFEGEEWGTKKPKKAKKKSKAQLRKEEREAAKEDREERKKEAAELELLMMDSKGAVGEDDFDQRKVLAEEKGGKRKRKRKRKSKSTEEDKSVNAADPRFSAVYSDPRFAIDPTAPQYKDTPQMRTILTERSKRRSAQKAEQRAQLERKQAAGVSTAQDTAPAQASLKDLVQSVKARLPAKAAAAPASAPAPASDKVAKKNKKSRKRKRTKKAKKSE